MGKYGAIQYIPRPQARQPLGESMVDAARQVCAADALSRGADMATFTFEELKPQSINGMTLESEDTPYKSSEWAAFRWTAELPE